MLNHPAPAGGALVTIASDIPQAQVPAQRSPFLPGELMRLLVPSRPGRFRQMESSEFCVPLMAMVGSKIRSECSRYSLEWS